MTLQKLQQLIVICAAISTFVSFGISIAFAQNDWIAVPALIVTVICYVWVKFNLYRLNQG